MWVEFVAGSRLAPRVCWEGDGIASAHLQPPTGFDSQTRRHMWVELVVGSCPFSKGFSPGSRVFLPPRKPTLQIPIRSAHLIIVMLKCALQVLSTNWFILSTFRIQLPQRSEKAVVGVTYCSLLHEVVSFFFSHTTNSQSIFKCRENKPEHRLKSPRICKTREEFLIPKGKTLEPSGVKQAWRNLIYLYFMRPL